MKKTSIKKTYSNLIIKAAKKYATLDANAACPWFNYQEKMPKEVEKLRKYK